MQRSPKKQPPEARPCGCICSASYFSFQEGKYILLIGYPPADSVGVHGLLGPVRKRQDAKEVPFNKGGQRFRRNRAGVVLTQGLRIRRDNPSISQSDNRRKRSAFIITVVELKVIAAAAIIGLSSSPKTG